MLLLGGRLDPDVREESTGSVVGNAAIRAEYSGAYQREPAELIDKRRGCATNS